MVVLDNIWHHSPRRKSMQICQHIDTMPATKAMAMYEEYDIWGDFVNGAQGLYGIRWCGVSEED